MFRSAAFACASLCLPAIADSWTVGLSGADFTQIQPAIDNASPGDIIHVAVGHFEGFTVDKPLSIVGSGCQMTYVQPASPFGFGDPVTITTADLGTRTVLAAMTINTLAGPTPLAVSAAGNVVLHDICVSAPGKVGIAVVDSTWVTVSGSRVNAYSGAPEGSPAMTAVNSEVWLTESELSGSSTLFERPPAPALVLLDATVYIARTMLKGGDGHTVIGSPNTCHTGAAALRASGASVLTVVGGGGKTIKTGKGGTFGCGQVVMHHDGAIELLDDSHLDITELTGLVGNPGVFVAGTSSYTVTGIGYPTSELSTKVAAPGSIVDSSVEATPSGTAVLLVSIDQSPAPLPLGTDGTLAVHPLNLVIAGVVTLNGAGEATRSLVVPNLPALVGSLPVLQWSEVAGNDVALGNPMFLSIL